MCEFRLVAFCLLLTAVCAPGSAVSAAEAEPHQPDPRTTCPVCGMKVSPHPGWTTRIVREDGSVLFFDGAKDMFRFLFDPGRYVADGDLEIETTFVTGYYEGRSIRGSEALFAIGSDVLGPMGAELVPLRTEDEAREFLRDHAAERIVRFADVTPEVISSLD